MNGYVIKSFSGQDPALQQYLNFIYVSYLKSLRNGNDWFGEIKASVFYDTHHKLIDAILKRPDCLVRIAVLPDDEDVAIAWSLCENNILHYVFVKANIEARKLGIASSLIPENINTVTHLTKIGLSIFKKKKKSKRLIFNPYT